MGSEHNQNGTVGMSDQGHASFDQDVWAGLQSPSHVDAEPIYVDNTLYALATDGSLTAFQAQAQDRTGPEISNMFPKDGDTVPGTNISYAATIVDEGSGIPPNSVSLTVDGTVLKSVRYSPDRNGIAVTPSPTPPPPLGDGPHTVVVTATEMRPP